MYLPMIDTLVAMVDLKDYESSVKFVLEKLEMIKNRAKENLKNNIKKIESIEIGEMTFEVLPNGRKGYAYILHNSFYELDLAQYRSKNKDFYPITIRIKSEALWCIGPRKAWNRIYECINSNIGLIATNKISRIDLCCHTDEISLKIEDSEKFKGNYFSHTIYVFRRKLTGINFGSSASGKIYCRIYDKYAEIMQKKNKKWFFEIWKTKGMNPKKVWNIEFQICREFLKDYHMETVGEAFDRLSTLWEFCTKKWIVKLELDHTRKENCTINSQWLKLQKVFSKFKSGPLIKREKQTKADAEMILPGAIGNVTTFCARAGIKDKSLGLQILEMYSNGYFRSKNTTFEEVVQKKMQLICGDEKDALREAPEELKSAVKIFSESEV